MKVKYVRSREFWMGMSSALPALSDTIWKALDKHQKRYRSVGVHDNPNDHKCGVSFEDEEAVAAREFVESA